MPRTYPEHPVVGVGAVIWKEDKFLLIKRGKPPMKGGWSLPGGGQELGETVKQAVLREVKEETGLEVTLSHLVDVVDVIMPDADERIKHHFTLVDYRCEWVSGKAVAGDDAADVRWARLDEIESLGLWDETKRIILASDEANAPFDVTTK